VKTLAGALALLLTLAPAAAAPPQAPPPGTVQIEGGAIRHEKSGIVFPERIDDMARILTGTELIMAMYAPADLREMFAGKVALLGVSAIAKDPGYEVMRERARGSFHETGVPEVVSEGRFAWPGHPNATTFHGVYRVGPYRKEYWRAWDAGWDATMIVTTPRKDEKLGEKLSAVVAETVYGGAGIAN